ncbi:NYN domain-containing protein [Dapis sp. BLCC M126]|uniref:NYN domain-containing protein n=1 Tax=Dapis sp. BLCC M126 TaxID=3400189 RepID=UPI003CEAF1CC
MRGYQSVDYSFINQPPEITYLFIDGGYLRDKYEKATSKWFNNDIVDVRNINFAAIKSHFKAKKVFYYDCLDEIQNKNEKDEDFEARKSKQKDDFNQIRSLEGYHVKLGSLVGTPNNKRQKEVDVLLTVDMMNHTIRNNMTNAVLIAGDRDFKPVVESLVNMGMYVKIASDPRSTSSEFRYAADNYIPLSFDNYYSWSSQELRNKYPFPKPYKMALQFVTKPSQPCDDANLLKQGKVNDDTVKLFKKENEFILYFPDITNGTSDLSCDRQERLELYYFLKYGKEIEWD